MPTKIFSTQIQNKADMAAMENMLTSLLGGERNKCSLIRSHDYQSLRLRALYRRAKDKDAPTLVMYGEGLKITLDSDNVGAIFLLEPETIETDEDAQTVLGKRKAVLHAPGIDDTPQALKELTLPQALNDLSIPQDFKELTLPQALNELSAPRCSV
jgi:hypothetical protein